MKQIIISIAFLSLLIFTDNKSEAQVTQPPQFDTCIYLQPLQGEWMSVNGNDTIKIYLRYHRSFSSDPETYDYTSDDLWGWIEYKKSNNIVISDYANRFATLPYNIDSLTYGLRPFILSPGRGGHRVVPVGYNPCVNPISEITGSFIDRLRCNERKTIMAAINPQGTQMSWYIEQPPAFLDSAWCGGLTLPRNFTLIKQ